MRGKHPVSRGRACPIRPVLVKMGNWNDRILFIFKLLQKLPVIVLIAVFAWTGFAFSQDEEEEENAFEYAMTLFSNKNYDGAIDEFKKFVELYPGSELAPKSAYFVGYCYEQKNYTKEAIKVYSKVAKAYKKTEWSAKSYFRMGKCQFEMDDADEAVKSLESAISEMPKSPEARNAINDLASYYIKQEKYYKARDAYSKIPDKHDADYEVAKVFIMEKKYAEALEIYTEYDDTENRVKMLEALGKHEEARNLLVEKTGGDVETMVTKIDSYIREKKYGLALKMVEKLVKKDLNLGLRKKLEIFVVQQDFGGAVLVYEEMYREGIDRQSSLYSALSLYKRLGNHRRVIARCEDYMREFPDSNRDQCLIMRGEAMEALGEYDNARKEYKQISDADQGQTYYAYTYLHEDKPLQAIEELREVAKSSREQWAAPACWGIADITERNLRNLEGTIDELRPIVRRFSQDWQVRALWRIATIYERLVKYPDAISSFRQIVDRYPTRGEAPLAMFEIANCYKKMGEIEKAKSTLYEIMKKYKNSTHGSRAHTLLETEYGVTDGSPTDGSPNK